MERHNLALVSSSSVYRELKWRHWLREHRWLKPRKRWEKPEATRPHEHWLIDITYILIQKVWWYLIPIIDLYSRYIVGWDLCPAARAEDIKRVVDFALAQWGFQEKAEKPILHSDNGPQMKAKSFTRFLRDLGVLNEFSRPHVPQDLAVLERFIRTTKQEEVYRSDYAHHREARESLARFFDYYNHRRPHQGIGQVTPYDKLMGRDEQIIQQRKLKSQQAQLYRKLENRRNQTQPEERATFSNTLPSEIFRERV